MTPEIQDREMRERIKDYQREEITEYHIYKNLASSVRDANNSEILTGMSHEEKSHYDTWRRYSGEDIGPDKPKIWLYSLMGRILGVTFTIKLMESRENNAIASYRKLEPFIPEAESIIRQEKDHEAKIISFIDEKRLQYVGSIVLGLNDALVEFTGSLAGFTFALQDPKIIAMVGFIMGIAASLSMAASEYLSQKTESGGSNPFTAATYTGLAYIVTVVVLILPFVFLPDPFIALLFTLGGALAIIVLFSFYTSVAKDLPFWKRFSEMAALSMGIAAVSFIIGVIVRTAFGV
jgi:VIT1/CCC1 family predicted Fe2+/Mn2+ transporter